MVRKSPIFSLSTQGFTLLEILITVALSSFTILALASILTFITSKNENLKTDMNSLNEFILSSELLEQYLAQTTRVLECNCNSNCLFCSDAAGCVDFPNPSVNPPPTPPTLAMCGTEDPSARVSASLGFPNDTLKNHCLFHVEFESLDIYPKHPGGNPIFPLPPVAPASEPWKELIDDDFNTGGIQNQGLGLCNDFNRSTARAAYAAGCWKDLYVYYVPPVVEAFPSTESKPGSLVFAVTTSASRNGGTTEPPLQVFEIGSASKQGAITNAIGVAGVACGYLPALRQDVSSLSGFSHLKSGVTIPPSDYRTPPADYSNAGSQYPRSLTFGLYVLAKARNRNILIQNSTPSNYESWHPSGNHFKNGRIFQLAKKINFQNLTERGIHFLKLNATKGFIQDHLVAGHNKSTGCYWNNVEPPSAKRTECCSGAMNSSNRCIACIPSGRVATGSHSCCSEHSPNAEGICP